MDFRDKDGEPLIKWDDPESCFEAWKECSRGRPCDYTGITYEKLRNGSGIQWPCNEDHPDGTERLYTDGDFNTRTKTARAPQLQNAAPDAWVEINPSDAERLGVAEGDVVGVETPRGHLEARARIGAIREGVIFVPFHYGYWDQPGENGPDGRPRAANELTITEWDPVSKQPLFKVGAARVTKVADSGGRPSPAPTTTASAPVSDGVSRGPRPPATVGGAGAEVEETLKEV